MFYVRVNICLILYGLDLVRQATFLGQHCIIFLKRVIFRCFRDVDICSNCLIILGCIITTKKRSFYFTPFTPILLVVDQFPPFPFISTPPISSKCGISPRPFLFYTVLG